MDRLLIPVAMLEVKLGKSLGTPTDVKYKSAEQAIWTVSVRARSVAGKTKTDWPDYESEDVPDLVKTVVLEASYRVFKNPNRYLMNQAFQFTGQLSQGELNGDIFLRSERDDLEKFKDNSGMWTQSVTRCSPVVDGVGGAIAVEGSGVLFPNIDWPW